MKIVVASDSFKGSLSSKEIGEIFKRKASEISDIEVVVAEIADGGEGTLDAVVDSGIFEKVAVECAGPLFEKVVAFYGKDKNGRAFVEMAQASGLTLIPYSEGNGLLTTTYGTGQLIAEAIKSGAKEVFISVGGSATNDGGIGALSALGYKFLDANDNELSPIGKNLAKIASIDTTMAMDVKNVRFVVLCDVDNPLVGKEGATMFFGRQKGISGADAVEIERGMCSYADVVEKTTGISLHDMKGAGAAGGLAGGLVAFLGAEIRSGIESVLSIIDFEKTVVGASLVVTGEGRIDDQSVHGKAISGVCSVAQRQGIPVVAMVGSCQISSKGKAMLGLIEIYKLSDYAQNVEDSIKNAKVYAEKTAEKIIKSVYKY